MVLENYDEMKKLDYRQQARDKISIWYSSRENYQHGLKELLANGIDELINNFEHGEMEVTLSDNCKRVSVRDTGRGMPLLEKMSDGTPYYENYFLTLFAGSKYDDAEKEEATYNTGTNGLGISVLCFTSVYFQAEVQYGDDKIQKHVRITYTDGGRNQEIEELPYDDKVGTFTKITYELDPEVYTNVIYDPEEVKDIVKHVSIPSNSVTLTMVFKDDISRFETSDFGGYFYDLVGNETTSAVFSGPMRDYESDELNKIQLLFTTMPNIYQESYLNGSYLSNKGSIHDGVMDGIRKFGNKYCADNKLFPKGITKLTKEDIEGSVSYLVKMLSTKADFVGQTKMRTEKTLYKKIASEQTGLMLEVAKNENPKALEKFFKHVIEVSKSNSQATKARAKLKKKLSEGVTGLSNRVEKLTDCRQHGEDSEIFFAEGDSAGGSIKQGRDSEYQSTFPLRGKILNILKSSESDIMKNEEIINMIKIIGAGLWSEKHPENFDIEKCRYGKIVIASDADSDGLHIQSLFISFIYKYMRPLIEAGRIYMLQTPLYIVHTEDDEIIHYFSDREKEQKFPKLKGNNNISRLKGLGEISAETMYEVALNRDTRTIVQVTIEDAEKVEESIETWLGKDGRKRKEIIAEELYKYVD